MRSCGHGIRFPSLTLRILCRLRFTLGPLLTLLFPLLLLQRQRLHVLDRKFLASASPSPGFIATPNSGTFLQFPIMLLHLLLELLHLRAGEPPGREGGKGLLDVDGEDFEDFLDVDAVFCGEGLGVEGSLEFGSEVGDHAAVPLSFAYFGGWIWGLLRCHFWCRVTRRLRECR